MARDSETEFAAKRGSMVDGRQQSDCEAYDKKPSPGVRIGDGFSHCASACVPKDGPMVHLLRLMKG